MVSESERHYLVDIGMDRLSGVTLDGEPAVLLGWGNEQATVRFRKPELNHLYILVDWDEVKLEMEHKRQFSSVGRPIYSGE